MHDFDLRTIDPTPWKNGGGATRQIAVWPPGAGLDDFDWRMSVAEVEASAPFSSYPGVERHLMLLQGAGLALHAPDGRGVHTLSEPWRPWVFAGEDVLHCRLLGGPSQDFNLMLRRGRWRGGVRIQHHTCTPGNTPAGLCLVLAGCWSDGQRHYRAGQGVWWSRAAPGNAWQAQCAEPPAALAWVALNLVEKAFED